MPCRSQVRYLESYSECISWLEQEATENVTFTEAQLADVRALWERGECFVFPRRQELRWFEVIVAAVNTHAQEFILIERDVTEERSELEALKDFFDNGSLCLRWVAEDGTILRANRKELDFLGYSANEYIGHSIGEFHVDKEVFHSSSNNSHTESVLLIVKHPYGIVMAVFAMHSSIHRSGILRAASFFTRDVSLKTSQKGRS